MAKPLPLSAGIWRVPNWDAPPAGGPDVTADAFLQQVLFYWSDFENPDLTAQANRVIYFGAGTDVRTSPGGLGNLIECPLGSGSWYGVLDVQDIDKGLATEQRRAVCRWLFQTVFPIP